MSDGQQYNYESETITRTMGNREPIKPTKNLIVRHDRGDYGRPGGTQGVKHKGLRLTDRDRKTRILTVIVLYDMSKGEYARHK